MDTDTNTNTSADLTTLGLNAALDTEGISYNDPRFNFKLDDTQKNAAWIIDKSRHNPSLKTHEIKPRNPHEAHLGGNGSGVFFYEGNPPTLIAGDPLSWLPHLWHSLLVKTGAISVLDVGSGLGYASSIFSLLGAETTAVEGLKYNVENAIHPTIHHDLSKEAFKTNKPFGLVWCCEVAEHVDPKNITPFLETITNCDTLALTAAPPGDGGHHHVNCQPREYWIEKVKSYGLYFDADETEYMRKIAVAHGERKDSHFQRNGMIFKK